MYMHCFQNQTDEKCYAMITFSCMCTWGVKFTCLLTDAYVASKSWFLCLHVHELLLLFLPKIPSMHNLIAACIGSKRSVVDFLLKTISCFYQLQMHIQPLDTNFP